MGTEGTFLLLNSVESHMLASAASRSWAQKHIRKESLQPLVADAGQNVRM